MTETSASHAAGAAESPPAATLRSYQISAFLLTFSAYAAFHASRKPPSIVKSVLHTPAGDGGGGGWPPFDGSRGTHRLGELDLAFLVAYAAVMFAAGHAADRTDLRFLLAAGMLGSAAAAGAMAAAYFLSVHRLWFFLAAQVASGLFQSVGWPCVVAVVGNWFGKSRRGLVMGVWSSHTSVGNILGSVIASVALGMGWGWSFVFPGALIGLLGVVVLKWLVVSPEQVGLDVLEVEMSWGGDDEEEGEGEEGELLGGETMDLPVGAIGFLDAWRLPGERPMRFASSSPNWWPIPSFTGCRSISGILVIGLLFDSIL